MIGSSTRGHPLRRLIPRLPHVVYYPYGRFHAANKSCTHCQYYTLLFRDNTAAFQVQTVQTF